ncbi:MAG: hypothetical protein ACI9YH_000724 [Colwellia sp.]|jgi:hypothetical protein
MRSLIANAREMMLQILIANAREIMLQKSISLGKMVCVSFFILLFISVNTQAKVVTAKGISDIVEGKKAKTRSIALNNAKRAAVEQVAGAFVQSRSTVTDFVIAQDKIYSSSSGNISTYTVLSEGINDFGAYEVEIEANVDVQELLVDIKEILKVNGWSRKPRITLNVNSNNASLGNTLKSLFITKLNRNGFEVFDDSKKVQTGFVLEINADLQTNKSDYQGISISSNNLSIVTNVTRTDDGQVIATRTQNASKAGSNLGKIAQQLSNKLVRKAWRGLKNEILDFWQEEQYIARSIYLDVKQLNNFEQAKSFSRSLKQSISGLLDIELIEFSKEKSQYLLKYKGWPEQLYDEVFAGPLKSEYQLELISVNANHVTLRIN